MKRRTLLAGTAATIAATPLAMPSLAQGKPEKLIYVGDNGPWHFALVEEVGPAFEKETGIKVDYTLLPSDPWNARLRAELNSGSSTIDVCQWSVGMAGWISPHFDDHNELIAQIMARDPDWDWNDFLAGAKKAGSYNGRQIGIPYRITTGIMNYQKQLLADAGFTQFPRTFEELRQAAIKLNHPPERYGFGMSARQGPAMYTNFAPWLYSAGGGTVDFATNTILINSPEALEACEVWSGLVLKDKVVPPDCMTWDFDEIVAGGQNDRYAMCQTFAPYGTLINDAKLSKTGGKWAWDTFPGKTDKSQSKSWVDGHNLSVPKYTKNKDWALRFIEMACNKFYMKRSMIRGNAPPRGSVLRDPEMVKLIGWTEVAAKSIETGVVTPANPVFPTLELTLRSGLSQVLLGQKPAKQALDEVAADWQRSLRRAGTIR